MISVLTLKSIIIPLILHQKTEIIKNKIELKELKSKVLIFLKVKTAIIGVMIAVYCSEDGN